MHRLCSLATRGYCRAGAQSTATRALHSVLRRETGEEGVSSLRSRLESDANALEVETKKGSHRATASIAARLANYAECSLPPNTPHYLQSAMDDSAQPRVIAECEPPYRVTWVSPSWQELTGHRGQVVGRPAMAVLLSAQAGGGEVARLMESLHLRQRGCGTLACSTSSKGHAFPARVTVNPLIDAETGESSMMLFIVKPLV